MKKSKSRGYGRAAAAAVVLGAVALLFTANALRVEDNKLRDQFKKGDRLTDDLIKHYRTGR